MYLCLSPYVPQSLYAGYTANTMFYYNILKILILIVLIIVFSTIIYDEFDGTLFRADTKVNKMGPLIHPSKNGPLIHPSKNIPIYVVVCNGTDEKETSRQLRQTITLLKSAAALTKVTLRFEIFSHTKSLYEEIMKSLKKWPEEFQSRLQMDFRQIMYPKELKESDIKYHLMRPCGSYRLLFPDMLPDVDSAVYIDTDTIFMESPETLFEKFKNFNEEEAAAIAPAGFTKVHKIKYPFPGTKGLNSGIMLMNFTRLRSAPGGGFTTQVTKNLLKEYKNKIKPGDQGLINIYFTLYPELLHELGCEWNYIVSHCKWNHHGTSHNTCLEAEKHGASLIHGIAQHFTKKGVVKEWRNVGTTRKSERTGIQSDRELLRL